MPCVLYCIAELHCEVPSGRGVRNAGIEALDSSGLRCYYSTLEGIGPDRVAIQRDALDFHRVTRALFEQFAIIPFRFPTLVSSTAEIGAYLDQHAEAYGDALKKFADTVQMELRISLQEPAALDAGSGVEYLKRRAGRAQQVEQAVTACRTAIQEVVVDWRQRETSLGVRCYVLVKREAVRNFQEQIKQVRLDGGVAAAASGPWPPTEFLPDFG